MQSGLLVPRAVLRLLVPAILAASAVSFPQTLLAQAPVSFLGTTAVGKTATTNTTATVTVETGGIATAVTAWTQGAATAEFHVLAGGTCAAGVFLPGQQCTVNLSFSPAFAGLRWGAARLVTSSGAVLGQGVVNGVGLGGLGVLRSGTINVYAGSSDWIYDGDGRLATNSAVFLPQGLAKDAAGNLYLADSSNNRVRRVDAGGIISTVAGSALVGYSGDGGAATSAALNQPTALALDGGNNLYILDSGNSCVRRVDGITGIISTYAGTCGVVGNSGDGGPATLAHMQGPEGMAMDAAGNLYVSDTTNNLVRKIDAVTHIISTFAGTGGYAYNGDGIAATTATLNTPWGLALGLDNGLYVADQFHFRIRRVDLSTHVITTVAGTGMSQATPDGSLATQSGLAQPAAVALDPAGNLYIGDEESNLVREVSAATGILSTIVGGSTAVGSGYGNGKPADLSAVYGPYGLLVDQMGNLFISDMFHNQVRIVSGNSLALPEFTALQVGRVSAPVVRDFQNIGNAALTISGFTTVNTALEFNATTCQTAPMSSGADCNLGVQFAPTSIGADVAGSVSVATDAPNSPDVITVDGPALKVNPATLSLTSNINPSLVGSAVTLTATVTSLDTAVTGTITFLDGTTPLCNTVKISANAATCTLSTLTLGSHSLTASYSGDDNNAAAVSGTLIQVVRQASTTALSAAPNPAEITSPVTLIATVTVPTGTATGSVVFYDGASAVGTAPVDTTGHATLSTASLAGGTRSLTAAYSGDSTDMPSTSPAVSEVITLAPTTTTLGTSNANVPAGTSVTFTANVSTGISLAPTGTVQFLDGPTLLGTGAIANGVATFTTTALPAGTHTITAKYLGDASNATSSSPGLTETVQQIATLTLVSVDRNPANAGQVVTLSASVSIAAGATADGALTGSVTFTDGGITLGTVTLDVNHLASLPVAAFKVGTHAIVATYSGGTNYATSTSSTLSVVVNQTSTATGLSVSGTFLTGKAVSLTATVSSSTAIPTGTVTFYDGTTVLGQGTVNAQGVATLSSTSLTTGSHNLTAVYGGDANYVTSTSAGVPEVILQAQPVITLSGPAQAVNAGTAAVLSSALSSNGVSPTGTLTLLEGGAALAAQKISAGGQFSFSISSLSVGTHTLTVAYSGDVNNAAVTSNTVSVVVQQGGTATALTSSKNPQTLGQAVTFSAAVTSPSPGITGSIGFYDGTTLLGSVPVAADGTANFTTTSLTFGAHSVTAAYAGDTTHTASTSPAIAERIVQGVTIGLTSNANPAVTGTPVTFTIKLGGSASTPPTGTVALQDGTNLLATITIDGTGTAVYTTSTLAVGSHNLTATYGGDTNYSSGSAALIETVNNANTSITLTASANPATYGSPLTLQAVVLSTGGIATGSITFTEGTTTIGSGVLDGTGAATLITSSLAPGAHTLVANYAGDGKATASVSGPLVVVVKQATTVALASSANPAQTLNPITFTATVGNAGRDTAAGTITFMDDTVALGTVALDATGAATLTVPQLAAATHPITAVYAGNGTNFAATSAVLSEVVAKRTTTTALTATVSPTNSQQVTLIAVVRWASGTPPTGNVVFTNGSATVGTAAVDGTGVATLVINNSLQSLSLVATYVGDTAYSGSASPVTTISAQQNPQFTLSLSPASMTLVSKQHAVSMLTIASPGVFTDMLEYGCLGLPTAATCTFSQTTGNLQAGGTMQVQLTVDTGDPLGAGSTSALTSQTTPRVLECFLPAALLAGLGLYRRRKIKLGALLALLLAVGAVFSTTGCGGLNVNGTPAGNYTFQVTARGQNTNVTESQTMTLTVTQ